MRFKMKEINEVNLLKKFKKESGWSYRKLSNHIGVHDQTIFGWFSGRCNPSFLALEKLQKFLRKIDRENEIEETK